MTNAILNGVFKHHVESVRKHDDPEVPEFSKKDWQQNFEVLDNWLHGCRGNSSKLPLSYVIRDDTEPSAEATNTFSDHDAALSAKAEIVHNAGPPIECSDQFRMDNQKVINLMVEAFGSDALATSHMKKFKRRKNGRGAHNALRNQVLGTDAVMNLSAKAENTLRNLSYNGEQRRFDSR